MLISRFNNITKDDIYQMQYKYNITLPSAYADFLLAYNGGLTPDTTFRINKISSDIEGFYGMGDVDLSFNSLDLKYWINKGVLPIAEDSFGNYIVIGLSAKYNGQIFFCDHELGFKLSYLTNDIREFCKKCKSEPIDEFARKSIAEREAILIENGRGDVINDELKKMWQEEIDRYGNIHQEEVKF